MKLKIEKLPMRIENENQNRETVGALKFFEYKDKNPEELCLY